MDIRLIAREDIEAPRWNGCVHYAHNSRIYGYTWYLDNICDGWLGLVEGNYESVFPLVWNQKIGSIKQLHQPLLCQQLGIFSVRACSQPRMRAFVEAIPDEYRYIDIALNSANGGFQPPAGYSLESRPNYILSLNKPYEELYAGYSSNLRRKLKKADKEGFYIAPTVKPELLAEMARQSNKERGIVIPERCYYSMMRMAYNAAHRGKGTIWGVYRQKDQSLCAAMLLLFNGARITNLFNASTAEGLELNAMAVLIDRLIEQQANKPAFIDFEGSAIEGVAQFYQSFGAELEPYYRLQRNNLPWWANIAKKLAALRR